MAQAFVDGYEALPADHEVRTWEDVREAYGLIRNGQRERTTHLPLGYLRNTLTLTLLALLIILPIRGRTDLWLKAWHRRYIKRLKPGQCPHCGYDTTGLTQCPECGAPAANEKPATNQ